MLALGVADKSLGDTSDIISDSSGVGTANSDTNCSITMPGATVVCIEAYTSKEEGSVCIRPGDFIEGKLTHLKNQRSYVIVVSSNWCNWWWVPWRHREEWRKRHRIVPSTLRSRSATKKSQHSNTHDGGQGLQTVFEQQSCRPKRIHPIELQTFRNPTQNQKVRTNQHTHINHLSKRFCSDTLGYPVSRRQWYSIAAKKASASYYAEPKQRHRSWNWHHRKSVPPSSTWTTWTRAAWPTWAA